MPRATVVAAVFLISYQLFLLQASIAVPNLMAPTFLWSRHSSRVSSADATNNVNYQTISYKDLVSSILFQAGWHNSLCTDKQDQQQLDFALIFVGGDLDQTSALRNLLKDSFTRSNNSMAFPYVMPSDEKFESVFTKLLSESCDSSSQLANLAVSESCAVDLDPVTKLSDLDEINEYLVSRHEMKQSGPADMVVFCHQQAEAGTPHRRDEGDAFTRLVDTAESLNANYAVLYVSRSSLSPPRRYLAEENSTDVSLNSTYCNDVCQAKSSLLEGLFVGVVLLIILLSGLCCMMGIDTPMRFEAPKES